LATQGNQQRNFNEISMNKESKNQYHEDVCHNSDHVPRLSPNHLSYPISPVNTQGRRKGGAEGANALSIFGKLQQLSQILGEIEIFAPVAGFETNMHHQF